MPVSTLSHYEAMSWIQKNFQDLLPVSSRSDPAMAWPVLELDRADDLFGDQIAITMGPVYRADAIPALKDMLLFGDIVSGEVLAVPVDDALSARGGGAAIRRVLFTSHSRPDDDPTTLLELLSADRADLRIDAGPDGAIFLLNKQDGILRRIFRPTGGPRLAVSGAGGVTDGAPHLEFVVAATWPTPPAGGGTTHRTSCGSRHRPGSGSMPPAPSARRDGR